MKKLEIVSVRLQTEERDSLERLAEHCDRSKSYLLRRFLLAGLRKNKKYRAKEVA